MLALLIVEDDVETLNLYSRMIKASFPEMKVDTATNPVEAISLFSQHKHDIVVSDLRVPKKDDGLVIARAICDQKPDAVIFFVTAEANALLQSVKPNLRHFCINDILGKPLNIKKLIGKIAEVVAIIG